MNIQIVTKNQNLNEFEGKCVINSLNQPKAFDMFDVNIIDISYETIWRNKGIDSGSINDISDFNSIKKMIESSKKANNILILPQNIYYRRNDLSLQGPEKYKYSIQLKDMISSLSLNILNKIVNFTKNFELIYENSETNIQGINISSAFVLKILNLAYSVKTKTVGGEKATTLSYRNFYITTLDVLSEWDNFLCFIKELGLYKDEQEPYPEWLESYHILDDEVLFQKNSEHQYEIERLQNEIDDNNRKLEDNRKYKSILYTNGDQLVEQVFVILEKILDCNLSEFKDEKKEDFLIKFQDVTFIGEIKGVTSNIKSENISQLDVHYQGYLDKLQEEEREETVKQILIMNPFRTKPLSERAEVHEIQINLAKRNGCLVIETVTLLKLYEKLVNQEITPYEVKEVFKNEDGLLSLDVFNL